MKNIFLVLVILVAGGVSSSSFAKEVPKHKLVVIAFNDNETKTPKPISVDERRVMAAQARHVASDRSLDLAIENLD